MERLREVDDHVGTVARQAEEVRNALTALDLGVIDPDELRRALEDLEPIWDELFAKERARVLSLLLEEVVYDAAAGEVAITFRPGGPKALETT